MSIPNGPSGQPASGPKSASGPHGKTSTEQLQDRFAAVMMPNYGIRRPRWCAARAASSGTPTAVSTPT